eukprot:SAG22_NODE_797_length_7135_cov_211.841103_5_plen_89_part_00
MNVQRPKELVFISVLNSAETPVKSRVRFCGSLSQLAEGDRNSESKSLTDTCTVFSLEVREHVRSSPLKFASPSQRASMPTSRPNLFAK